MGWVTRSTAPASHGTPGGTSAQGGRYPPFMLETCDHRVDLMAVAPAGSRRRRARFPGVPTMRSATMILLLAGSVASMAVGSVRQDGVVGPVVPASSTAGAAGPLEAQVAGDNLPFRISPDSQYVVQKGARASSAGDSRTGRGHSSPHLPSAGTAPTSGSSPTTRKPYCSPARRRRWRRKTSGRCRSRDRPPLRSFCRYRPTIRWE